MRAFLLAVVWFYAAWACWRCITAGRWCDPVDPHDDWYRTEYEEGAATPKREKE